MDNRQSHTHQAAQKLEWEQITTMVIKEDEVENKRKNNTISEGSRNTSSHRIEYTQAPINKLVV